MGVKSEDTLVEVGRVRLEAVAGVISVATPRIENSSSDLTANAANRGRMWQRIESPMVGGVGDPSIAIESAAGVHAVRRFAWV